LKHGIFGNLQPSQFASLASLAKNHDPIAEANNLWQLRAYHDDPATFDNVLELLTLGGRSVPHAVMMMIPEAHEGRDDMPAT